MSKKSRFGNPKRHPHGTRARYVGAKCRCDECKAANRAYYHERKRKEAEAAPQHKANDVSLLIPRVVSQPAGAHWRVYVHRDRKTGQYGWEFVQAHTFGQLHWQFVQGCPGLDGKPCEHGSALKGKMTKYGVCDLCRRKMGWNGLVDASPARQHLKILSRRQVGYKQVADAAGVAGSVVAKIVSGKKARIRYSTEQAILEVDIGARADGALVPAGPSQKLLKKLIKMGYPRYELAKRLGAKAKRPALQLLKTKEMTVRTVSKVQKLYDGIMEEQRIMEEMKKFCTMCGHSHAKRNRLRLLRECLPATSSVIKEIYFCMYGGGKGSSKEAALIRDLHEIGAVKDGTKHAQDVPWVLPGARRIM